MEWFVLTAVFTDPAYKICESGVSKKKKEKKLTPKLCKRHSDVAELFGQSEFGDGTLLANLCYKAAEPAKH